jgi:hypothetical protein
MTVSVSPDSNCCGICPNVYWVVSGVSVNVQCRRGGAWRAGSRHRKRVGPGAMLLGRPVLVRAKRCRDGSDIGV